MNSYVTALLRYNSCTIKFTFKVYNCVDLKRPTEHIPSCIIIITNSETFF